MKRVAVFNDTSWDRHFGCDAVMSALVANLKIRNLNPVLFWPVGKDWRPHTQQLSNVPFDAIIVNGEGTIHHSETRSRARTLLELSNLARQLGKPAFLLNSTIYAIPDEDMILLRGFARIFVREEASRAFLAKHLIESTCVPDLSMAHPTLASHSPRRSGILFTDSVVREVESILRGRAAQGGHPYVPMRQRKSRFEDLIERIRRKARKVTGVQPPAWQTRYVARSNFKGFVRQLRSAELVVTGRFHTVTLCLATGTPFIAVDSNTPKISYVATDALGSSERIFASAGKLDAALEEDLLRWMTFNAAEASSLAQYRAKTAASVQDMFDGIVADLR